MSKIDLSIIIASYNTHGVISDCVRSIIKNTHGLEYEIIIVENGSKDGSLEEVRGLEKKFAQVKVIDAKENLGYGKANNLAAKKARGEFLLILNSDTLIFDNAIKESVDNFKKYPHAGAYSCRLLNADKTVQPSGGHFPTLGNLIAWQLFIDDLPFIGEMIPSFHPQQAAYDRDQRLDWVTGAFIIFPKKLFLEAGGFDENIFMYTEEMELFYRLSQVGHRVVYENKPAIIHLGGLSNGSVFAISSEVKYMIYFWKKHKPAWQLPLVKLSLYIGSLLRLLIFGIIKGDEKARRAYSQALGLIA